MGFRSLSLCCAIWLNSRKFTLHRKHPPTSRSPPQLSSVLKSLSRNVLPARIPPSTSQRRTLIWPIVIKSVLWGYCATTGKNRTCSSPKFNWAASSLNTSSIDTLAASTGTNITLPSDIKHALKTFTVVSKWTQVVYIIALIATAQPNSSWVSLPSAREPLHA
ncbi:hypothetical protein EYC84_002394 [Monilinia fructicola]|uniref:Uncharacterized protein n=1 Tax=Monilinia fructicola TaxID=38448 RepID=A0A5M9JPW4_MONFR|nr:hypothetical protein EYC84_002394 [Monilinia fructicola]